jgi:tellurite resistance protein TerC
MIVAWLLFITLVLVLLALDLGVFHRSAHVVTFREAIGWSLVWLTLGLGFAGVVYVGYEHGWCGLGTVVDPVDGSFNDGAAAMGKYLTGYVVEKSLSVDNIFVIAMIFSGLAVPRLYQHRVLFWGVAGAVAMRAVMIVLGARLIAEFHWLLGVFAVLLIVTAVRMLMAREEHWDPAQSRVLRWCRRLVPIVDEYHGQRFLVRRPAAAGGLVAFTPLAVALVLVEAADLVFAVDSIPAIFAITGDPFLVFTSNVFAILGLRSLYFLLAGMVGKFRYLKPALAAVLLVVGGKMLAAKPLHDLLGPRFNLVLLGVIVGILVTGVVASMIADRRRRPVGSETAVGLP